MNNSALEGKARPIRSRKKLATFDAMLFGAVHQALNGVKDKMVFQLSVHVCDKSVRAAYVSPVGHRQGMHGIAYEHPCRSRSPSAAL